MALDRGHLRFKKENRARPGFHKASYEEYPLAVDHGKGSKIYDVDGNEYIDYVGGLGPMILGYSPEALNEAVKRQIDLGSHFSAPTKNLLTCRKICGFELSESVASSSINNLIKFS